MLVAIGSLFHAHIHSLSLACTLVPFLRFSFSYSFPKLLLLLQVNLTGRDKLYNYRGRGGAVTPPNSNAAGSNSPTSSLKRSISTMSNSVSNLGLGGGGDSSRHSTPVTASASAMSTAGSSTTVAATSAAASKEAAAAAAAAATLARNNTGEVVRGSVIGGSALVDLRVLGVPYPNEVVATSKVQYVQVWCGRGTCIHG